ncbi:Flp pilus assembly protein CpaB [Falsiroseomonas sp.]|uniref:Flp pilus assembly protein CpaB n=1 Tax=Falsiroseomonas sp. TaxID=2870721 RepID=UPI003568CF87
MTFRRLAIIILLLAAGGLGGIAVRGAPPPPSMEAIAAPAPPPPPVVRVLAAARGLSSGALINEADIAIVELPSAPEEALLATPNAQAEFRGSLVRRFVPPGALLTREDLLHPGERGFLAAVLQPDHRAISIGVDAVTGAGGLVVPGDLVDLVLVQSFDAAEAPASRRVTAETILTRLRVIAVDQQVQQGTQSGVGALRVARTVTLEVTPEEAERVAVAEQLGRLAVTVRPAVDGTEPARVAMPVFGSDVSSALGSAAVPTPARMRVIQGNDAQEVTFR